MYSLLDPYTKLFSNPNPFWNPSFLVNCQWLEWSVGWVESPSSTERDYVLWLASFFFCPVHLQEYPQEHTWRHAGPTKLTGHRDMDMPLVSHPANWLMAAPRNFPLGMQGQTKSPQSCRSWRASHWKALITPLTLRRVNSLTPWQLKLNQRWFQLGL